MTLNTRCNKCLKGLTITLPADCTETEAETIARFMLCESCDTGKRQLPKGFNSMTLQIMPDNYQLTFERSIPSAKPHPLATGVRMPDNNSRMAQDVARQAGVGCMHSDDQDAVAGKPGHTAERIEDHQVLV